jgi:hypothetical protein
LGLVASVSRFYRDTFELEDDNGGAQIGQVFVFAFGSMMVLFAGIGSAPRFRRCSAWLSQVLAP